MNGQLSLWPLSPYVLTNQFPWRKTLEFGPKDVPVDDLNCGRSSTELQVPGPGQSDAQALPGRRQLPRVAAKLSSPENKLTVKLFFSKLFHLRFACHREAVTDLAEFPSPFNHDLITAVLLTGLLRSRSSQVEFTEPGFKAATVDNANRSGAFFSISHRLGSAASHETRALSGKDFGRKRSAN